MDIFDIDIFTFYQINHSLLVLLLASISVYIIFGIIDYCFYFFHKFLKKDLEISV